MLVQRLGNTVTLSMYSSSYGMFAVITDETRNNIDGAFVRPKSIVQDLNKSYLQANSVILLARLANCNVSNWQTYRAC